MMRNTILAAAVALGTLCLTSRADAGDHHWGIQLGFGSHGTQVRVGYSHGHRRGVDRGYHRGIRLQRPQFRYGRRHHTHVRQPVFSRVWVQPVYGTVLAGYDTCGNPIYRRAIVRAGYWHNRITGYHCGTCRIALH